MKSSAKPAKRRIGITAKELCSVLETPSSKLIILQEKTKDFVYFKMQNKDDMHLFRLFSGEKHLVKKINGVLEKSGYKEGMVYADFPEIEPTNNIDLFFITQDDYVITQDDYVIFCEECGDEFNEGGMNMFIDVKFMEKILEAYMIAKPAV